MKYTKKTLIHKPLVYVWALLENPGNAPNWYPIVKSRTLVGGVYGHTGCVSRIIVNIEGGDKEIIERFVDRIELQKLSVSYEENDKIITITSLLKDTGNKSTEWIVEVDVNYKQITGKLSALFEKKKFEKLTIKTINDFKFKSENIMI